MSEKENILCKRTDKTIYYTIYARIWKLRGNTVFFYSDAKLWNQNVPDNKTLPVKITKCIKYINHLVGSLKTLLQDGIVGVC